MGTIIQLATLVTSGSIISACEGLSNKDFNYLQKCPLSYICTKCCKTAGGDFDFDRSLERLGIATRSGDVEKALKLEVIFFQNA